MDKAKLNKTCLGIGEWGGKVIDVGKIGGVM
jgi:hypothetical protein